MTIRRVLIVDDDEDVRNITELAAQIFSGYFIGGHGLVYFSRVTRLTPFINKNFSFLQ